MFLDIDALYTAISSFTASVRCDSARCVGITVSDKLGDLRILEYTDVTGVMNNEGHFEVMYRLTNSLQFDGAPNVASKSSR